MKKKKAKYIGGFSIRKKTIGGLDMDQRCFVYNNGVVEIRDYIVFTNNEVPTFMTPVKSMFGKTVCFRQFGLRLNTLKEIAHYSQKIMTDAGVKLSDLA